MAQGEGIPSIVIIFIRLVLSIIVMTPFVWNRYSYSIPTISRGDWFWIGASGFWLALNLMALFWSLEYASVLVTSTVRRTAPLWVIVLEIILLSAIVTRKIWMGMALTIIGIILIGLGSTDTSLDLGTNPLLGTTIALVGAICFACYVIIGRRFRMRLPSLLYSWLVFICAMLISGVVVLLSNLSVVGYSATGYFWVVMITLIAQLMGHIFINLSLQTYSATTVSIAFQLTVIGGGIFAFFFFNEIPTELQIIGSIVVIVGVLIALKPSRPIVTNP